MTSKKFVSNILSTLHHNHENSKSQTFPTKLISSDNDFERGQMDKFDVEMNDIGDPLICKLSELKTYLMIFL